MAMIVVIIIDISLLMSKQVSPFKFRRERESAAVQIEILPLYPNTTLFTENKKKDTIIRIYIIHTMD
jgi:hypothetical protein